MSETMKDSQGNEFKVGSVLRSIETKVNDGDLTCIDISSETALFITPLESEKIPLTQGSITNSQWVVVDGWIGIGEQS